MPNNVLIAKVYHGNIYIVENNFFYGIHDSENPSQSASPIFFRVIATPFSKGTPTSSEIQKHYLIWINSLERKTGRKKL